MTSEKEILSLHRPKIHVQTIELGPHRQRIFTLPKFEPEKKYTPFIWMTASLVVGFFVASTVFNSLVDSYHYAKDAIIKTDIIAFAPEVVENRPLGSDDSAEEEPDWSTEVKAGTYYKLNETSGVPRTSALSFLVADISNGQTILEKSTEMVLPMASVSKLMAAVIAKETLDQHSLIKVTRSSIDTYGTAGGLVAGEMILVTDLLHALLSESSNDAAEVLAAGLGRTEFMRLMNAKTKELKMNSTHYDDPSGLSQNNVSSVKDLLILARFINSEMPEIWDITRVREFAILSHKWLNGNNQLKKPSFIGGKNGFTDEALRTSVSLFDVPLTIKGKTEKEKKRIAVIVLKSVDRDGDISKLLRYVETNMGFEKLADSGLDVDYQTEAPSR